MILRGRFGALPITKKDVMRAILTRTDLLKDLLNMSNAPGKGLES